MRKIKLFIASSLDGYIADTNGQITFLNTLSQNEPDTTYDEFIQTIDTVILGSSTYLQIINELAIDNYPYKDMDSFVFSTQPNLPLKENVTVLNQSVVSLLTQLKQKKGKDIWIVGGASIINPLVEAKLIDDYHISIIPCLLGEGIPLFTSKSNVTALILHSQTAINDIIHTHYTVNKTTQKVR